jgi:hypothetical protein
MAVCDDLVGSHRWPGHTAGLFSGGYLAAAQTCAGAL